VRDEDVAGKDVLDRLRRIEGQVRGIRRMVEERRDCEAVLTQVMAARTALEGVAGRVVAAHIDECMASRPADEARAKIVRAVALLGRVG